jgi:hypothetical protein
MASNGSIRFWAGHATPSSAPFFVTDAGALTASSGQIASWDIFDDRLVGTSLTLWSTGQVNSAGGFSIATNGAFYATNGQIAAWNMTNSAIYQVNNGFANVTSGAMYFGTCGISLTNKFSVTSDGLLTSVSGTIGGWTLSGAGLTNATGDVALYANGQANFGSGFSVSSVGAMQATAGTIGGWSILSDRISSIPAATNLWSNGQINSGSLFSVNATGYMRASGGVIGGFTIATDRLYEGTAFILNTVAHSIVLWNGASGYVGMDADNGFWAGASTWAGASSKFRVSNAGVINGSSGTIGPWIFTSSAFYKGNSTFNSTTASSIYLGTSGLSVHNVFSVNSTGRLYSKDLYAVSGTIAGWTFNSTGFSGANSTLAYSGQIYLQSEAALAALVAKGGSLYLQSWNNDVLLSANGSTKGVKVTSSTNIFSVDVASGVYINRTSAGSLQLTATVTNLTTTASGFLYLGFTDNTAGETPVHISASGALYKYTSSERYKDILYETDLLDSAKILLNMPILAYKMKANPKNLDSFINAATGIGYSAERIEAAGLYELVVYDDKDRPESVSYQLTGLYAMTLIKDLYNEINSLKYEIQTLKSERALQPSL